VAHYKTTSGSAIASTNNAVGEVGLVFNYDPAAPGYTNQVEAQETGGVRLTVPSKSIFCGLESKKLRNTLPWYYMQPDPNDPSARFQYPATLNQFVQGQQADNITLGQLWFEYDITLIDTVHESSGEDPHSATYSLAATSASTSIGVATSKGDNLGVTFADGYVNLAAGTSSGQYLVLYIANCTSTEEIPVIDPADWSSNITGTTFLGNPGWVYVPTGSNADVTKMAMAYFDKSDENAAQFSIVWSSNVDTSGGYLFVTPLYIAPTLLSKEEGLLKKMFDEFMSGKVPALKRVKAVQEEQEEMEVITK